MYNNELCMLKYIPELIDAGISSFKIEGRFKSEYYVSVITKAYRDAIEKKDENTLRDLLREGREAKEESEKCNV